MNRTLRKAQFFLTPEQPAEHHGQLLLTEQNFLIYSYILGEITSHSWHEICTCPKSALECYLLQPQIMTMDQDLHNARLFFLNDREKNTWKTLPYKPQLLDTTVQSYSWTQSTLQALNAISSLDRNVSEGCHDPYTQLNQLLRLTTKIPHLLPLSHRTFL